MNEDRVQAVTALSILLLVIGLAFQSFGHVCHDGGSAGEPRSTQDTSCCEASAFAASDDCPACILKLQGRSLGPTAVAAFATLAPDGRVDLTCRLALPAPCPSGPLARAPPHPS